jgi:putative hydrolase of the HAD superfamily
MQDDCFDHFGMKIFFDIDGVLIDNLHAVRGWVNRWDADLEKDLGISPDHLQEIFKGWFNDVLRGRLDLEECLNYWFAEKNYALQPAALLEYWHTKDSVLNHAVWSIVRQLAQNPAVGLYLATNQSHNRARYLWDTLEFKKYFKKIYYSAQLGCVKEEPEYFRFIEEDLAIDPQRERVLLFDDHPKNIAVASARGWNAVLFDTAKDCANHPLVRKALAA